MEDSRTPPTGHAVAQCIYDAGCTEQNRTKVSEWTNRNLPARNTLVQLLALYTNPESQNAQHYRQMDDNDDANSRSYCVAVRSAKNGECAYFLNIITTYNLALTLSLKVKNTIIVPIFF